jgi:hypothetical protein
MHVQHAQTRSRTGLGPGATIGAPGTESPVAAKDIASERRRRRIQTTVVPGVIERLRTKAAGTRADAPRPQCPGDRTRSGLGARYPLGNSWLATDKAGDPWRLWVVRLGVRSAPCRAHPATTGAPRQGSHPPPHRVASTPPPLLLSFWFWFCWHQLRCLVRHPSARQARNVHYSHWRQSLSGPCRKFAARSGGRPGRG